MNKQIHSVLIYSKVPSYKRWNDYKQHNEKYKTKYPHLQDLQAIHFYLLTNFIIWVENLYSAFDNFIFYLHLPEKNEVVKISGTRENIIKYTKELMTPDEKAHFEEYD